MQWDATRYAGFSAVDPWLPVSEDYTQRNVAVMEKDPNSILNLYHQLLALRKESTALQYGSYAPIELLTENCFIYRRETDREMFIIALNFSDEEQIFSLADTGSGTIALSTHLDCEGEISLKDISLRPNEGLMIKF
jgi:alpha-glucosidase